MRFMDMLRYVTGKQNKSDEPVQIQPIGAQIVRSKAKTSLADAIEKGKRYGDYDLENKNWGCGCYSFDTLINDFNSRKSGEFTGYLATISNRFAPYCSEWGTVRLVLQTYKLEEALGRLDTDVKSSFASLDVLESSSLDAVVKICNANYCRRPGKEYGTNREPEIVTIGYQVPAQFLNYASLFAKHGYVEQADNILRSVSTSQYRYEHKDSKDFREIAKSMASKLVETTYGTIVRSAKMPISDKYAQIIYLAEKKGDTTSQIAKFVSRGRFNFAPVDIIADLEVGVRLNQNEILAEKHKAENVQKSRTHAFDQTLSSHNNTLRDFEKLLAPAEGLYREIIQSQVTEENLKMSQLKDAYESELGQYQEKIVSLNLQIAQNENLLPKRKMTKDMYKKLYGQVRAKRKQTSVN
jgi:hypothetical protein